MANRRGLVNDERLGLNATTISATGTILAAPLFLFSVTVGLNDLASTGDLILADTSGSSAADVTAADFLGVKLGSGGVSASTLPVTIQYNKPIYVQTGLVASATNCEVSVTYLDAS